MTRKIMVGGVLIGGGAPVTIQSMCNTKTDDVAATVAQIHDLEAEGCEIVRLAVPDFSSAQAIARIKERIQIPLVADIHFDWRLALEAVAAGADKIRINPGNIGGPDKVQAVAEACDSKGVPIRIGVNGGSLEDSILRKYGGVTADALVESALKEIALLEQFDFKNICVSVKTSSVPMTIEAYSMLSRKTDYPLHLGVTESGTPKMGLLKSAMGIGGLLCMGIGDTIRVSLTASPVAEVRAAKQILQAAGLRKTGPELISCPTCGRTRIDLIRLANEVERRLEGCGKNITVAVMGCVVNGPGEAAAADVGIAGGVGTGILFRKGKKLKTVPQDQLVDQLMELIESL
ncbi:MAG: flavodoxin-dependent (E)-4-hydroxy-3-methylbut-2-enyl-diphosphate synthase [Oscillospiraceae bacterium]|nr:flavodoxin-dependent (E)-4-hydroxy-3-methylbut-2-enyl-diphosphate synthase [Oscillospiraceae bacterium]